jgi:DNA-directed RNA polymerase subunit D
MKVIKKTGEKLVFEAEVSESLANAIRRYINQIPVLAVDEVEISRNDSPLYDEVVAHRIGLIPLIMDKSANEKTTAQINLKVSKEGIVNAGEFEGNVKVAHEGIPITFLKKGQLLTLNASIKAGRGITHSKYIPGLLFYRNVASIKVDGDCPKDIVNTCPKNIFSLNGGKISLNDVSDCDICNACVEACKKHGKDFVKIKPSDKLVITMESFGQLDSLEIIKRSIDVLKKDLDFEEG